MTWTYVPTETDTSKYPYSFGVPAPWQKQRYVSDWVDIGGGQTYVLEQGGKAYNDYPTSFTNPNNPRAQDNVVLGLIADEYWDDYNDNEYRWFYNNPFDHSQDGTVVDYHKVFCPWHTVTRGRGDNTVGQFTCTGDGFGERTGFSFLGVDTPYTTGIGRFYGSPVEVISWYPTDIFGSGALIAAAEQGAFQFKLRNALTPHVHYSESNFAGGSFKAIDAALRQAVPTTYDGRTIGTAFATTSAVVTSGGIEEVEGLPEVVRVEFRLGAWADGTALYDARETATTNTIDQGLTVYADTPLRDSFQIMCGTKVFGTGTTMSWPAGPWTYTKRTARESFFTAQPYWAMSYVDWAGTVGTITTAVHEFAPAQFGGSEPIGPDHVFAGLTSTDGISADLAPFPIPGATATNSGACSAGTPNGNVRVRVFVKLPRVKLWSAAPTGPDYVVPNLTASPMGSRVRYQPII